jgi:hypothetical protein
LSALPPQPETCGGRTQKGGSPSFSKGKNSWLQVGATLIQASAYVNAEICSFVANRLLNPDE